LLEKLVNNDGTFETGILANSLAWDSASLLDDLNTNVLIKVLTLEIVELFAGIEESGTTSWNNTLV